MSTNKIKILIADEVDKDLIYRIKQLNFDLTYLPGISIEKLKNIIFEYNCLIIRGRLKISKEVLDRSVNLKIIIRYGVGLDNIDLQYCKMKNIKVYNTPAAFTEAVAELTLTLILGILRGVGEAHRLLKEGIWAKYNFVGKELQNKVVGIIGFGRIGQRVADLLQPFNVKILAYDIIPIPEKYRKRGVIQVKNLIDIAEKADIITIHAALTEKTRHMINEEFLKRCRDGVYIINTARGEIIDEAALKKYIKLNKIGGIALDVFKDEPNVNGELISITNGLFTPHIGAQTIEARKKAVDEIIEILKRKFRNLL